MTSYRDRIDALRVKRKSLKEIIESGKVRLEEASERKADADQALQIAAEVSRSLQRMAHEGLSRVVAMCLRAVFDDPYDFRVEFEERRGRTEAVMVFSRDGKDFRDPKEEVGGGVVDVAALALRVACITMSRPRMRRLLVLDEPFKNVRGSENKARLREMLLALSKDMGFQFVLNVDVEAYPEFALGKIVEFE